MAFTQPITATLLILPFNLLAKITKVLVNIQMALHRKIPLIMRASPYLLLAVLLPMTLANA